jgi:hypothetical protein
MTSPLCTRKTGLSDKRNIRLGSQPSKPDIREGTNHRHKTQTCADPKTQQLTSHIPHQPCSSTRPPSRTSFRQPQSYTPQPSTSPQAGNTRHPQLYHNPSFQPNKPPVDSRLVDKLWKEAAPVDSTRPMSRSWSGSRTCFANNRSPTIPDLRVSPQTSSLKMNQRKTHRSPQPNTTPLISTTTTHPTTVRIIKPPSPNPLRSGKPS